MKTIFALALLAATSTLLAQDPGQLPKNLVLDLDADLGVTVEEGDQVALWQNQVAGFAARDFVLRDKGRKTPGSGRPRLRKAVQELRGHNALVFLQQELVCLDEDAFDSLTQGGGCTWLAVLAVREQRVGLKDVNSFFGNLKNGGNYEGLWGNVTDDNRLWWGLRNGITFGRFDTNNQQLFGPKLETGRFAIVAGRMAAGTGKVKLELFANGPDSAASLEVPANPKGNPSKMAVGQERDAVEHPGVESFDGEIARLLIFARPLEDAELKTLMTSMRDRYGIQPKAVANTTGATQAGPGVARTAEDSTPAPSNVGNADYPRIASNLRVTFRLKAPNAKLVKLEGGAGLVKEPLEMTRGDDGTWSVTTPPAVPGFHYYWFTVDGLRVNDPSSYSWFGWARETSGIEVPEAGVDFYHANPAVPHGEVRQRWYFSKLTGKWRRAHVYTPPDYDKSLGTRYPVLYLQHGAGENERGWVEQGHANFILDNLIAVGKAKPMILVVDTGYAAYASTNGPSSFRRTAGPTAAFEEVILTELIPMIDGTYRTLTDRKSRAMAGLSMGSGQTLNITLKHLDQFAWIGAMSGPPRQGFEVKTAYDGVFSNATAFSHEVSRHHRRAHSRQRAGGA